MNDYPKPRPGEVKSRFITRFSKSPAICRDEPDKKKRRELAELVWADPDATFLWEERSPATEDLIDPEVQSDGGCDEFTDD